jgi:hypothetical protein
MPFVGEFTYCCICQHEYITFYLGNLKGVAKNYLMRKVASGGQQRGSEKWHP